eukprot:m.106484 g.106484  ORF g.106484 m.106484 type:complete len:80 (-) comp13301_c0_seq2:354-593(-)
METHIDSSPAALTNRRVEMTFVVENDINQHQPIIMTPSNHMYCLQRWPRLSLTPVHFIPKPSMLVLFLSCTTHAHTTAF